jgi:predicted DNA-binding ribbon-helix-helix protein
MLIEKNIQIEDALWDRLVEISSVNKLPVNAIVSEAVELFIDQSTYAEER